MRVYQFTEQPYFPAWPEHTGSLRVNLPNGKQDPAIAADLLHRYYDEWLLGELIDAHGAYSRTQRSKRALAFAKVMAGLVPAMTVV